MSKRCLESGRIQVLHVIYTEGCLVCHNTSFGFPNECISKNILTISAKIFVVVGRRALPRCSFNSFGLMYLSVESVVAGILFKMTKKILHDTITLKVFSAVRF